VTVELLLIFSFGFPPARERSMLRKNNEIEQPCYSTALN
jgi:hypothetical protein